MPRNLISLGLDAVLYTNAAALLPPPSFSDASHGIAFPDFTATGTGPRRIELLLATDVAGALENVRVHVFEKTAAFPAGRWKTLTVAGDSILSASWPFTATGVPESVDLSEIGAPDRIAISIENQNGTLVSAWLQLKEVL